MGSEREWRAVAGELYMFIMRYCTPSGMIPEGVLRSTLGRYVELNKKAETDD